MTADPPGRGTGQASAHPGLGIPPDLLDLDAEQFRQLGHWIVERIAHHLATLADRPAITTRDATELASLLGGPVPLAGAPVEEGLALLADIALEAQQHGDHPRYFARVPGPSSQVGVLGEWLATGMQSIASSWVGGSGTASLEIIALGWLRDALGLAPDAEGILLSGGSTASTTALIAARAESGDGVLYLGEDAHASIARAIRSLGWPTDRVRTIASDGAGRMDVGALAQALAADRAAGRNAAAVVATVGTTNTGAVDDLPAIAALCRESGAWLHVDGAYGGPAALTEDRAGIRGLELADSFVLDPHKWLFQPYDIACLWVARPGALERTFAMHPEYLRDAQGRGTDLHNRSLELTRRSRAAKLWLSLRTYGIDRLADAISRGIALAEAAQGIVEREAALEVVTPARLGIVTFAVRGADAADHARIAAAVTASGYAALTSTLIDGAPALRLCTINPRTTEADLAGTVAAVLAAASSP